MIEIVRIDESFERFEELLALILSSFAYMDGVIDPPSSAHRLTLDTLAQKAKDEIAFVALDGQALMGCMFCKPEAASLYVGKLAVSPSAQGKGVGSTLLRKAEEVARDHGLPALRLETHRAYRQPSSLRGMGICEDGRELPSRLYPRDHYRDDEAALLIV